MKLKLDNGNVLHVKLDKDRDGINIMVGNEKDGESWYLASLFTDGTLHPAGYLQGNVKEGLQYDSKNKAIKVK